MTTPNTFWQLLQKYHIEVPMIQRDYAQGRNDKKTTEIRWSLLENLKEALIDNKRLHFDFVYGSIEANKLQPLDGQQRLTTLYLLHWYFALKEQFDVSATLVKFSYATRISARDFCQQLSTQPISYHEFKMSSVAELIKNRKWFQYHWQADPTVDAMLNMLNAIHETYQSIDQPIFDSLIQFDCPITFSFLELGQFGLSDDLYIKMNSRGKPLTTFENFKAQFEQLLEKNGFIVESKQFSLKIEQEWTELLWNYRIDYTIDDAFMELFTFISSAIYLKENPHHKSSNSFIYEFSKLSDIAHVYRTKENVAFLFDILSLWKNQREIHEQFDDIFKELTIFNSGNQLFDKCVNHTLQLDERVLLYTIIAKKLAKQETDLVDTLRVVRNLLNRVRQANNGVFNSNLRIESIGYILNTVDVFVSLNKPIYEAILEINSLPGIADRSLLQEKEKAEIILTKPHLKNALHDLEDYPRLKGAVHQWIDAFLAYPQQLKDTLIEIENLSMSLVSRAMLSFGNHSVKIGSSNLGTRYMFGGHNAKRELLWTNNEDALKHIFTKFISSVMNVNGNTMKEKVESLIDPTKEWKTTNLEYYFIKYDTMLKEYYQIFTIHSTARPFEIERLSGSNLQAVHVNPFYEAIILLIDDSEICSIEDCQKRLSERSEIRTSKNAIFKLSGLQWVFEVDPSIEAELKKYAQTLTNADIIEQGYALVMKAHELG